MDAAALRAVQAPLTAQYTDDPGAALVAGAGGTLRAGASALGPEVAGAVRAEGDLRVRGPLGVDKPAPVGFRDIRVASDLDSTADADQLATLLRLTERCCVVRSCVVRSCVVLQTLQSAPTTSVRVDTAGAAQ